MKNTLKQAQFCFQNNIIIFGPQKKRKRKMKRKGVGPEGREFAGGSTERRTAWQLPHLRHGPRHRSPQPLVALKISDTNFFLYYYNYHHYCRSIHLTFLHKKILIISTSQAGLPRHLIEPQAKPASIIYWYDVLV